MRVIVFVKATKDSEAGVMPSQELLAAMGAYNQSLIQAGVMKDGGGLKPTRFAKRVRFSGSSRIVTDGPFTETKEIVSGYWIWEVKSIEEAVEWLKKCPNPMLTDSDIDIRPLFGPEDFA
jgi:PhnB protein